MNDVIEIAKQKEDSLHTYYSKVGMAVIKLANEEMPDRYKIKKKLGDEPAMIIEYSKTKDLTSLTYDYYLTSMHIHRLKAIIWLNAFYEHLKVRYSILDKVKENTGLEMFNDKSAVLKREADTLASLFKNGNEYLF